MCRTNNLTYNLSDALNSKTLKAPTFVYYRKCLREANQLIRCNALAQLAVIRGRHAHRLLIWPVY